MDTFFFIGVHFIVKTYSDHTIQMIRYAVHNGKNILLSIYLFIWLSVHKAHEPSFFFFQNLKTKLFQANIQRSSWKSYFLVKKIKYFYI